MYPTLLLTIGTKGKLTLAFRRGIRDKVEAEAWSLVMALGNAKRTTGVYAWDYDPASWQRSGHLFLNEFVTWSPSQLERTLLSQIIGKTPGFSMTCHQPAAFPS